MEAARRPCAWRWSRAGAVAASPGAAVDVVIRTALAGAAASVITLRVGAARFRASSGRPSRPTKCNLSGPISLWCRNLHGCSDATSAHHLPPQKDVPCRQAHADAQSSGAAPTSELCVTRGAAWRHGCSAATSRNRSNRVLRRTELLDRAFWVNMVACSVRTACSSFVYSSNRVHAEEYYTRHQLTLS